jgi:hypothetical protein
MILVAKRFHFPTVQAQTAGVVTILRVSQISEMEGVWQEFLNGGTSVTSRFVCFLRARGERRQIAPIGFISRKLPR